MEASNAFTLGSTSVSHEPSPTAWHAVCWAHLFNNPELICLNVTRPEKDFMRLPKVLGLGYELGPYV
jgi:hypothetical protein